MPTDAAVKAEDTLIHVLWINAGLSCDGDSVALTAATQPSIEEIALGALPGLPQGRRPLAADRLRVRPDRWRRRLPRVVLQGRPRRARSVRARRRGLDPQRGDQGRGLLVRLRQRPGDRPADDHQRVARPARPPRPPAVVAVGTCATYGGIHAMAGNPTGAMGVPDYLGWDWKSKAGIPIVCVPGCPIQPDNLSETITYLLYQATGQAPMIPLDDALRPTWLFGSHRARGLRPGRLLRAGRLRHRVRLAEVHRQARLLGSGRQVQRPQARLDERRRRLPERRRHLHRLHDARLPGQVHAVHGRAARRQALHRPASRVYGTAIRRLRAITTDTVDKEPKWRTKGRELTTGAKRTW